MVFIPLSLLVIAFHLFWETIRLGISPMPSNQKFVQAMNRELQNYNNDLFIDLGCGHGKVLFSLKRNFLEVVGVERSFFPYLICKIRSFFHKTNIEILHEDFLQEKLPKNAILFTYLFPKGMEKLEKKLKKDRWKGVLISNFFSLPKAIPYKKVFIDDLSYSYLYVYHLDYSSPRAGGFLLDLIEER